LFVREQVECTLVGAMPQPGPKRRARTTDGARPDPPRAAAALLTTVEAAALLRVHPKQVYRLAAHGLPRHRVGFEWRYDRDELLAWTAGRGSPALPAALPAVVASNGDVVVSALLARATSEGGPVYGLALADRTAALGMLRQGRIVAAGYHGDSFPARVPEGRMARLHLVEREVGLVARGSRAPRLEDAARARLASRPPTAGVRAILDARLAAAGIDPAKVAARALTCASHRDAATAVVRGDADVGLVTRAWAFTLGLAFRRLDVEDFGLLFFAEHLGRPEIVRLCETAQSAAFRAELTPQLGYGAARCGRILLDPASADDEGDGPRGRAFPL
jgi:putative molybdopterin biosynthesis protein